MSACASLPSAIVTVGDARRRTAIPARAAYAAADADVLPVDAQITTLAPSSTAFEIAIVMPRSLNEPVGFEPLDLQQHARDAGALRDARRVDAAACCPRAA